MNKKDSIFLKKGKKYKKNYDQETRKSNEEGNMQHGTTAWDCRGSVEDEFRKNKAQGGEQGKEIEKVERPKQVKRREKKTGQVRNSTSNRRDPVKQF